MRIDGISIIGGHGRDGATEPVGRLDLNMGDVVSLVGPTGSGKTALVNDIALFADANTPSGRRLLINGAAPDESFLDDPSLNPIALITQHTTFLSDLPVERFLLTHARVRRSPRPEAAVAATVDFANQLTGEPILTDGAMTELSGGQTRALLIADAVVIGNAPVVLLDEIENAGIDRARALDLLRGYEKIFVFVTHDPGIALLSDFRVAMQGGAMRAILRTTAEERLVARRLMAIDAMLLGLRDRIRGGGRVGAADIDLTEAAVSGGRA